MLEWVCMYMHVPTCVYLCAQLVWVETRAYPTLSDFLQLRYTHPGLSLLCNQSKYHSLS